VFMPSVALKLATLKATAEQLGRYNARRPRRACAWSPRFAVWLPRWAFFAPWRGSPDRRARIQGRAGRL